MNIGFCFGGIVLFYSFDLFFVFFVFCYYMIETRLKNKFSNQQHCHLKETGVGGIFFFQKLTYHLSDVRNKYNYIKTTSR